MSLSAIDLGQSLGSRTQRVSMPPVSVGMDLVTVTLHSDYLSQIVRCLPVGEASLNPLPAPPPLSSRGQMYLQPCRQGE